MQQKVNYIQDKASSGNGLRYFTGYFGELLVLLYFKIKWYSIVKHRYRCRFGEIDLILSKGKELIFLEVKTSLFGKEIPISSTQCRSIITSSKYFLSKNSNFFRYSMRYDLCFLSLKRGVVYIENAWLDV